MLSRKQGNETTRYHEAMDLKSQKTGNKAVKTLQTKGHLLLQPHPVWQHQPHQEGLSLGQFLLVTPSGKNRFIKAGTQ